MAEERMNMGQDAQGSHDRAVEELSFKEASIELEHILRVLE